ncbi:restriction endonuclease [Desulfoferula mesophila]|uniref:Restriction endonuclease n=1 Tax=Desulfoferula mesophila TaxID=3058419 RepID=A0AAU9E897_9BACT|nr:restriction endonuclease [Desulfoferula mesophilus]
MSVWLVRAGGQGERQDFALAENRVVIGWDEMPDLAQYKTRDAMVRATEEAYPNEKPKAIINWVGQLWAFARRIEKDDLVVLPLKRQNAIAMGKITGDYEYKPDNPSGAKHLRPVKWLAPDMPRDNFDQDLLYSFGAFMTVCQIKRNNAETRIRAILAGKKSPSPTAITEDDVTSDVTAPPDLEDYSLTQIQAYIGQKFAGHKLAELIGAILDAQGYQTEVASPGPDGGVDIIAGRGPMGFDEPRLVVQVKSGASTQGIEVMDRLRGTMVTFKAQHGLFVAWGGVKHTVKTEARRHYFDVRVWDAGDVVQQVLRHYDAFPEDLKADLPLKRIWTLVQEGEE